VACRQLFALLVFGTLTCSRGAHDGSNRYGFDDAGRPGTVRSDGPAGLGSSPAGEAGSPPERVVPFEAGNEWGRGCLDVVQREAEDLVRQAWICEQGDTCEVVVWDSFLGRRGCTIALACYGLVSSRTDRTALRDAARMLAARYQACGSCGTAACVSLDGKRAVCDAGAKRCVLIDLTDASSTP
jgi:hypothetical protein